MVFEQIKDQDPPLTEAEIQEWLQRLSATDKGRASMLRDLLRNSNTDGMTPDDRTICICELRKLNRNLGLKDEQTPLP